MLDRIIFDVECIVCNKTLHKINHKPCQLSRNMGKVSYNSIRRSRTPNWSVEEKQCLLELIRDRKEIVLTKNNNGPNYSEEKDVAWKEILRELAAKFGNKFVGLSLKKVKTQWQNMKRIAREEISLQGGDLTLFSRQTLEVCHILDMIKDGVLVIENEATSSDTLIAPNIEIKAERIDDDTLPNGSDMGEEPMDTTGCTHLTNNNTQESHTSSEQNSELYDYEQVEETVPPVVPEKVLIVKKDASAMTDMSFQNEYSHHMAPIQKDLQEFLRFSHTEKQLKIDNLKEERQVTRALRETAELNKIIAEQKLKHVLWMRRQDPRYVCAHWLS